MKSAAHQQISRGLSPLCGSCAWSAPKGNRGKVRFMGLMNKLVKFGIAKKALDQAQKPENQQKAKDLLTQVSAKLKNRKGPASN